MAELDAVIFIVDERRDGLSNGESFTPGLIRGRAHLWHHASGRIECVADVSATSSSQIAVSRAVINGSQVLSAGGEDQSRIDADLDRQLEIAIATSMRASR